MANPGTVYLLHFDRAYKHAGHYVGFTKGDVSERLTEHANGTGARLTQVASRAGITFVLARTWKGGRKEERRLKAKGGASRMCPICCLERREARRALLQGGQVRVRITLALRPVENWPEEDETSDR